MALIRSKMTDLTPFDDDKLTDYLWPIIKEMIKTVIENKQNLIIEGCYVPYTYKKDFSKKYLDNIKYYCLVMSQNYINNHFNDIKKYESCIEQRNDASCTINNVLQDNENVLKNVKKHKLNYILIDDKYDINIDF